MSSPFEIPKYKIPNFRFGGEKKERKIDKNIRMKVWQKYIGNRPRGKCYCCEDIITWNNFQVGHNKARAKEGTDNIRNLRPICGSCNRGMGTRSIEWYKAKYFGKSGTKKKDNKKTKRRHRRKGTDSRFIGKGLFQRPRKLTFH